MSELTQPPTVDRSDMLRLLNEGLRIDPRRTAVITVDCHRRHLDPDGTSEALRNPFWAAVEGANQMLNGALPGRGSAGGTATPAARG